MRSTWPSLKDLSRSLQSSLDHLKEPVRRGGKFGTRMPSYFQSKPAWVHPRDRIPFWHVAPGDSVAVIRGEEGVRDKFGTVERVDRERNLVFLKEDIFRTRKRQGQTYPGEALTPGYKPRSILMPRPFHISNVRLRAERDGAEYTTTRIRRSAAAFDRVRGRFNWRRWGLVPELASADFDGWVEIQWPAQEREKVSPPQSLDTPKDVTALATFRPNEADLLDDRAPELTLPEREFTTGKQSRANRTKRWNKVDPQVRMLEKVLARTPGQALLL